MPEKERKRLDSWKEIAKYLRRDLTTVKRWEREKALPVYRLPGGKRNPVFAYQDEIDTWSSQGNSKTVLLAQIEVPELEIAPKPEITVGRPPDHRGARSRLSVYILPATALLILTGLSFFRLPFHQLRVTRYVPLTSDSHDKAGGMLLTDGVRVYFGEKSPDGVTLAAVAVAGGGTAVVPCPCIDTSIYDISPLRSELLAGRPPGNQEGGELWVLPLLGGSPRRIGNIRATSAKWSPDEQRIVFTTGRDLFIARADGSEVKKIAEVPGQTLFPRWSPDAQIIRFAENNYRDGEVWESIWEVKTDGSNLHKLLAGWNNPPHECCGVWTPDGKYFIFQSMNNGRTDLWAMRERKGWWDISSGRPFLLTSGLADGYSFPAVSADGRQIFAVGSQKRGELVRFDSRLQQFVPFLKGVSATWVSFSKSARSVAYIDYRDHTVWTAKADGSEKNQVTFSPFEVDGLSWSPDEKWLALRGRYPGKSWMLYLLPSTGGEPQLLLSGEKEQGVPSWSADGKKIAFGDVPPVFGEPLGTEQIHILNMSSHALLDLPGSLGLWTVRWSPDGQSLAALTTVDQKLKIYDFARNRWRATKADHVNNFTWSNGEKYIYYDTESDDRALRRVRVSDGTVENLASLHDYPNLSWWWSGITPDNSPLILRNLGTTEIYALSLESH